MTQRCRYGHTDTCVNEMSKTRSPQRDGKANGQPFIEPSENGQAEVSVVHPSNFLIESSNGVVERSVAERFEKIVLKYPGQLAVKMGERSLTYSELNAYSNRIARTILNRRGSGSEPIALLFEHGIDVIAAIFGVLKAGKFYLVLDPTSPIERLSCVLKDSQASMLISNYDNANLSQKLTSARLQHLNTDELDVVHPAERFEHLFISADALLNLTYTSGSTGNPKGVTRLHGRVLQSALLSASTRGIDERDKFSLVHSASFGSASTEIFQSLLNGAALCLFDIKKKGVREFANFLKREGITVCHLSPTTFRVLVRSTPTLSHFSKLRLLYLSGAPITRTDHELYKQKLPRSTLLEVAMGSTEAGYICHAILDHDFRFPDEGTPIGYAAPGKKVFILDEALREVSIGEIGQIAVRGANLNPGYWRRPDLTRNRYLADPDGGDERMYLTGDLGRMLPDGFVIHLGRKDLMVKVRGYRLHVGEVENALLEHPNVKEVGVAAWDREPGEKYLAAYVVVNPDSAPNASHLREFLSNRLPDYMVPSAFIYLDSLPLTNGKLDRSALPKPDHTRPGLNVPYISPRTPNEQTLSKIWSELLSVDRVGVDDNFFDLGGQSLAGAAILARVKETFGVELAVTDLLKRPTVALMAEAISRYSAGRVVPQPLQDAPEITIAPTHWSVESSDSFKSFPREEVEQSIPERFEKIVREYPHHLAVETGNEVMTYAELNAQANRIARLILERVERNVHPVALLFGKGSAQIIGMLAVLKAGKFFVLLDPSLPEERLAAILQNTGSELLLHDQKNAASATKVTSGDAQLLPPNFEDGDGSTQNLGLRILPEDLAYVVYTSGSTGMPKGVIQNHQNVLHRTMLRVRRDQIGPNDRFAHITSGTSNEITNAFYSLLTGASMVVFDLHKEGVARLAQWLVQERISLCSFATPLFRKLCETLTGTEHFPHLRSIAFRSDAIFKSDVELYEKFFSSNCVLVTSLSSTETGALTEAVIPKASQISGNEVSIGRPQPDKEILLLDDDGHRVGFNQIGEIVVKSKYLSPGYWRMPDLTAAKFRQDSEDPGERLYYTGDLGLMLPDGCLVHKGRKDFRLKIRGYGVDIVEVENALRDHAAVKEAVGMARRDELGETRLIAYFTPASQPGPTTSELREHLSKTLPDYMIPSAFVRLDALPLGPNGKVDRKALPEPDKTRPELSVSYVVPRTPVEGKLAEGWAEVLSVDRVGLHDNFFDLGGHSLSGARLVSLIHEEFGCDLPVSEFFAAPTIAQLAERIETESRRKLGLGKKAWTYLCELQRGNDRKPVFVFPGGGGGEPEFFVYGFLARHVGTGYPFYGLRARGADGTLQPHTSVAQMAEAYVEEIRAIQPEGPYFLVGECAGGVNAYEAARQLQAQGQEVAMLVLMDVERPTRIKYLRFRMSRWLEPVRQWWRENYYLTRIPYHFRQLRLSALDQYPNYFLGRLGNTFKATHKKPRTVDSRQERAAIVLHTVAPGEGLRHIEWVRENYRRTVRRIQPTPFNGHVEVIVSEKLYRRDPALGWKKLALKGLSIHPVPGDHWSYIRNHVEVAGLKLRECLERAEKKLTPRR